MLVVEASWIAVEDGTDGVETPCEDEPPSELLTGPLEDIVESGGATMLELDNEGLITMLVRLVKVLPVVSP